MNLTYAGHFIPTVFLLVIFCLVTTAVPYEAFPAPEVFVSRTGKDTNPGSQDRPFASLTRAQQAAREAKDSVVIIRAGTYYLPETLVFTPADNGTEYRAAEGETVVLSGGTRLNLRWEPGQGDTMKAATPPGLTMDQLFVNGRRQPMARYPNFDPEARPFHGTAADAIAPERVVRWNNPAGGFIHAMHAALWGDMHWRILGKKADGSLSYEGGWQNNRPSRMHPQFRFVENIREELDASGEWFHDAPDQILYFIPSADMDLTNATIEVVRLRHLIEFQGTNEKPVQDITLQGITFRHTARTFMENREPLLRSDWTVYRGGALEFNGAEDVVIEGCDFLQLGGNAVFLNNYNRRITVRNCLIRNCGANGIAFVGNPKAVRSPLFQYGSHFDYAKLDRTPGPIGEDFPADCRVEDCLITRTGRFEKQTAPVQISMAQDITIRHCSIYDVPRAGINIGDGCWGGHLIEHCDVFDTVLETGDHGSFNSWGRDRYWHPNVRLVDRQVAADPALPWLDMVKPTTLRHNRWRCDHGWDIDLDDGSSRYRIYNNLLLHGGLKLREGYDRIATNNIIVNNSLHPHVWFEQSGDVFTRNIVMGPYRPARMDIAQWGKELDRNLFTTAEADRQKFTQHGCDANSLVGDPMFLDAANGDFRVASASPAIRLGFDNFPMNTFGVRSPRLRVIARLPAIPKVEIQAEARASEQPGGEIHWQGATLRELMHYEFSALGVAPDTGGLIVGEVPRNFPAYAAGLRKGDLIQRVNDQPVHGARSWRAIIVNTKPGSTIRLDILRHQQPQSIQLKTSAVSP